MFCSCRISTHKCLARSLCNSRATCYTYGSHRTELAIGIFVQTFSVPSLCGRIQRIPNPNPTNLGLTLNITLLTLLT